MGRFPIGDTASAMAIVPVAAGTPFELCRGLLVGTAGAATVTDGVGGTRTLIPLQQGYNPISITNVSATGLTAADIWALY
jgi:hypothetical protein